MEAGLMKNIIYIYMIYIYIYTTKSNTSMLIK